MAHRIVIGLHLVLIRDGQVLLGLRKNTSWADQTWHLTAGHLEEGESILAGTAREAKEELGLVIAEDDLDLIHTLHHLDADDGKSRLQMFFRPSRYTGEITNSEPDKCAELRWFDLDALPKPVVPYIVTALDGIRAGKNLSLDGWRR
ncbi:NUDIX domain-containing protein [Streptomyces sp. NBC_00885]|uniref:NUDIX hydrolase n=1 Tax=Streptomyces sp. NBC_00885 TaxID=2975857 RepID=UPI003869EC01|nr:NUDIX domain-containing protein [Streptomyces sp. NBC_00885]